MPCTDLDPDEEDPLPGTAYKPFCLMHPGGPPELTHFGLAADTSSTLITALSYMRFIGSTDGRWKSSEQDVGDISSRSAVVAFLVGICWSRCG